MEKRVYIFGAHSRAQTLGVYLTKLNSDWKLEAYLVDNEETNEEFIDSVPVLRIQHDTKLNTHLPVYIGTRGIYHERITSLLEAIGMEQIIPVTPELDMELRNRYLEKHCTEMGRNFDKLDNYVSTCIYVIKSASDQPLKQAYALSGVLR